MKKDDIEFLKELQHELNTQTNDGNASPVYWAIEEDKQEIGMDGDEPYVYVPGECETYSMKRFIEIISEEVEERNNEELSDAWIAVDKDDIYEVVEFANEFGIMSGCYHVWLKTVRHTSNQTGCFITKRAAQKHLEQNYYHYSNGHTYALTAWRNPEFERLMNIIKTMDLSDLKEDNG